MRGLESYKNGCAESQPISETTPLVAVAGRTKGGKKGEFWGEKSYNRLIKHGRYATGRRQALMGTGLTGGLSQEQLLNLIDAFAREDKDEGKTWARRLVEKFLQKCEWYYPGRRVKDAPCLSKAWAFFEHVTLPRYHLSSADHVFRMADPGEPEHTALYQPATIPEYCFIEWGIGVDQYFCSLKALSVMFLLCAFINVPNMLYYSSSAYSTGKDHLPWSLRASAICARKEWVVCVDCTAEQWGWPEVADTFGTTPNGTTVVQRNDCGRFMLMDGVLDFGTFVFVAIFMSTLAVYLHIREIRFDEDRLTADDYSIDVVNPPADAYDPDEWKDYFNQFALKQVTVVTVALDNSVLVNQLVNRRKFIDELQKLLPLPVNLDEEAEVQEALSKLIKERERLTRSRLSKVFENLLRVAGFLIQPETLVQKINDLTAKIKELQAHKHDVARVFVTFETEEGQRQALSALSNEPTRLFDVMNTKTAKTIPYFRGVALRIDRAVEPSNVRWLDLGTHSRRTAIVTTLNLFITLAVIAVAAWCENISRKRHGPLYAGALVSVFNSVIPVVVETLSKYEQHTTEGSWQISYFTKLTLFRWVNTAIVTQLFTPLISNLGDHPSDVLPAMRAILISELFLTPLLRFLDISGNIQRHVIAPRALTQSEMNLNFLGTPYRLGERFTALTNVLFVCFFYSSLFPCVFFYGFAILVVQYYTDKYCLVRIWRRAAAIGPRLARISRRYFFTLAVMVFIVSSAYSWAQFPYDNVCDKEGSTERVLQKKFDNVLLLDGSLRNITVHQNTAVYYCSQDIKDFDVSLPFPPTSGIQPNGLKWMTEQQEEICAMFGWTSLAVVIALILYFLKEIRTFVSSLIRPTHTPSITKSQMIDFSSHECMEAYIPQLNLATLPYPLIACDIDGVDKDFLGWVDPMHTYDRHNLIFDVPIAGQRRRRTGTHVSEKRNPNGERKEVAYCRSDRPIFSVVKHYPPEWQRHLNVEREMIGGSFVDSFDDSWKPLC